jgi:hypothetical protein
VTYLTDDAHGDGWHIALGDSCERLGELADESIDFSVYSPPFASLFTYSPSDRDLGNCSTRDEFLTHYGFIIREVLRVTKPGRLSAVHVQQLTSTKAVHGVIGLTDFRGQVIAAHQAEGWIFHGEITVDKCPQAQAIRTKAHALMFATLERDSSNNRPALADYVLLFRKPGDNAVPVKPQVTRDEWIDWARPIWKDTGDAVEDTAGCVAPWYGINETDTLNADVARDDPDERHVCPLQRGLIERCVRLWTNEGETVLSPFTGIGSEGVVSLTLARRFEGCELKQSYWATAVKNMRDTEIDLSSRLPLELGGTAA